MKISKNPISIILVLLVLLLYGQKSHSGAAENKAMPSSTDVNSSGAAFWDPTTNEDFSCTVSFSKNRYIKGEPVLVKVRLTNHMNDDVTVRDCVQHYPFYSFEISDPAWRQIKLKKKLETSFAELDTEFKIIKPNQSYNVEIGLSDWYDFSQIGRYSIKAKWCCFMKRTPYERNSVITDIVIVPREPKEWFDLNKIPVEPIWSGVPDEWSENILREKLTAYLRTKMEQDFNDVTTSTKNGGIHLAYHTKEYHFEAPSDKSLEADVKPYKAEMVPRNETGPQSDGLILDIWLNEQVGQLVRPQLLDRTYWKLYLTELYLPELKLYLDANINYGADINKDVLARYMDIADWMDDIAGTKERTNADSNGLSLPDYAQDVLRVFSKWQPTWEIIQCDETPTLKINGYDGYRLVVRQSWKENLTGVSNLAITNDPNAYYHLNHIDLVLIKNEDALPDNSIEKIPWLALEQEYFVKPVYMGKGKGFDWFANTTIYSQEYLRKGLNLEGGEDRLNLLMEGLYIEDKGGMTSNSVPLLLPGFGDKAVEAIERVVQTHNDKGSSRAIRALCEIQSQKSTELIKRYYYSENSSIRNAAVSCLIHKPLRKQAKQEYFDLLAKQGYINLIGNTCIDFEWKDALPILEDICSKPKAWGNYYSAYLLKRKFEGNPVPEGLIKARDTIINTMLSTQDNAENASKAIAKANQTFIESPDKEAAAAIACSLVIFITKGNNIIKVRDIGWDILSQLPKPETTKLYKILEGSLDSKEDRDLLQKFHEIIN